MIYLGTKLDIAKQCDIIFRHDLLDANKQSCYNPLKAAYLCIPTNIVGVKCQAAAADMECVLLLAGLQKSACSVHSEQQVQ